MSVTISNYDSRTDYNITIVWTQTSCDDGTGISGQFVEQYMPAMIYSITEVYAGGDYDITVMISNIAGSVASDILNVSTMETGI